MTSPHTLTFFHKQSNAALLSAAVSPPPPPTTEVTATAVAAVEVATKEPSSAPHNSNSDSNNSNSNNNNNSNGVGELVVRSKQPLQGVARVPAVLAAAVHVEGPSASTSQARGATVVAGQTTLRVSPAVKEMADTCLPHHRPQLPPPLQQQQLQQQQALQQK